ncbi:hypothetical protein D3C72_1722150 [compost metagenome]
MPAFRRPRRWCLAVAGAAHRHGDGVCGRMHRLLATRTEARFCGGHLGVGGTHENGKRQNPKVEGHADPLAISSLVIRIEEPGRGAGRRSQRQVGCDCGGHHSSRQQGSHQDHRTCSSSQRHQATDGPPRRPTGSGLGGIVRRVRFRLVPVGHAPTISSPERLNNSDGFNWFGRSEP